MTITSVFIDELEKAIEDRGKMAALRRGLGQPPGTCADMFPIIAPLLPRDCTVRDERRHYLIASLYAYHPANSGMGNMGDHMRQVCNADNEAATSRRFSVLLVAHPDDLPLYLRQAVSYLKSREQPINWRQLYADLKHWDHPDRYIQRRWANAFWGFRPENEDKQANE